MTNNKVFSGNTNYLNMSDENLVQEIVISDNKIALNYLMERYNNIVNMKANKFFMVGAEKEDIIQEGMIGLYKAVKSFNAEKQNSFKTFANLCIERQLITAVKNSNRQKHVPLNSSISLNSAAYSENEDTAMIEILNTKTVDDPLDIIAKKEYFNSIQTEINDSLSDFELQVLNYYKKGFSYATIAEKLNTKTKSVDTAIQRIRKKALKIKTDYETDKK